MGNNENTSTEQANLSQDATATSGASLADLGLEVVDRNDGEIYVDRPVRHIRTIGMM